MGLYCGFRIVLKPSVYFIHINMSNMIYHRGCVLQNTKNIYDFVFFCKTQSKPWGIFFDRE